MGGGPNLNSLVKYDTPSLLTTKDKRPPKPGKGGKKLPPVEGKAQVTQTEDILNSILPPREWTEDGQLWVQYVSATPATRLDVINTQEHLDQRLLARQARETGICPVREELYAQCFGARAASPAIPPHQHASMLSLVSHGVLALT
eukprot:scaffold199405_cov37-Tisochrysis_lutea.AAC.1